MSDNIWQEIIKYASDMSMLEFGGLAAGLLCVFFLIRQNILTWPFGILYVLISFVVFWQARLYGDFILHIVFLILNIYGWYSWIKGKQEDDLPIKNLNAKSGILTILLTGVGIWLFAQFLIRLPHIFEGIESAALPYWDSTTSILSVTGMWLTARKFIDNWYYWLVVDVLATGIYFYKGIYFYSFLYFVYIGMAIAGYLAWRKSQQLQLT